MSVGEATEVEGTKVENPCLKGPLPKKNFQMVKILQSHKKQSNWLEIVDAITNVVKIS